MSKSDSPASSNKSTSDEDEDGPAAEYGDVHRMIVQGFMSYGFLGPAGVKGLFKEAYKRCGEGKSISQYFFPNHSWCRLLIHGSKFCSSSSQGPRRSDVGINRKGREGD